MGFPLSGACGSMDELARNDVSRILASAGDVTASEQLVPLLYEELRKLAKARMAKLPPGQTLQTTALVHEAYLRLASDPEASWSGRGHFFKAASIAMRNILVDAARRKASHKHGGGRKRIELEHADFVIEAPDEDILAVNEALKTLEERDPEKAHIVLLRYFCGLTNDETAEALGLSHATVERRWRFVRAWLRSQLSGSDSEDIAHE